MPKYNVSYGIIEWYSGTVEADTEDEAIDIIMSGERDLKHCDSELYDGVFVEEIKNDNG